MSYTIAKKQLSPQPVVLIRKRIRREEIAATIGGAFPHIMQYAAQNGITLTGPPFARYSDMREGTMVIEPGMPIASRQDDAPKPPVQGSHGVEVIEDTLPGGWAVTTMHLGPYEDLPNALAAIDAWLKQEGIQPAGAPWESYLTDPADYPDPKDWKTRVVCPIAG